MDGNKQEQDTLVNRYGIVSSYMSEDLGIIKSKSKKILFHKKAVCCPENVEKDLKKLLPIGRPVHFNADYVKQQDLVKLVATLIWIGKKPKTYVSCPLSEYCENDTNKHASELQKLNGESSTETFVSKNNDEVSVNGLHKLTAINDIPEPKYKDDTIKSLATACSSETPTCETHLYREPSSIIDIRNVKLQQNPYFETYDVLLTKGQVFRYLSNDFGIMACNLKGQQHFVFFSRSTLICPDSLNNIPLACILPLNESFTVDIEVFIHNHQSQFFRVNAIKIKTKKIRHLLLCNERRYLLDSQHMSSTEVSQTVQEGFIQLKGVVVDVSAINGTIECSISNTVCHVTFYKENVFIPGNDFYFSLKDYMPVGISVIFSIFNSNASDRSSLTASIVRLDDCSFTPTVSPVTMITEKSETFCVCETFSTGIIVGHLPDEEAVIKCKVLSVNCMVNFHKSNVGIQTVPKNKSFFECFPVGANVHFNAKIFCSNELLKVVVSDVFLFEEKIGIVTNVKSKSLTAIVNINGQRYDVDSKITHFRNSSGNRDSEGDNLINHITVGEQVLLEMKKTENFKWMAYRAERISSTNALSENSSNIKTEGPKPKTDSKSKAVLHYCPLQNTVLNEESCNGNEKEHILSFSQSIEERSLHSGFKGELNSAAYSKNIPDHSQPIQNSGVNKSSPICTEIIHNGAYVTVDFQLTNIQQYVALQSYSAATVNGQIVSYLSNDLGIIAFRFENELNHVFFTRSVVICSADLGNIPLVSVLPINQSVNVDIEVCTHNFHKYLVVKRVLVLNKTNVTLLQNMSDSHSESNQRYNNIPEGFVKIRGVVSDVVSRKHKQGIISCEIFGTTCDVRFNKGNVYIPGKTVYYPIPVGTDVNIYILNHEGTNINSLNASIVQLDYSFNKVKHTHFFNSSCTCENETFCTLESKTGIVVGHISDEEVLINCQILSVNCIVRYHENITILYKKQQNIKFLERFPVGSSVRVATRIACCGDLVKVALLYVLYTKTRAPRMRHRLGVDLRKLSQHKQSKTEVVSRSPPIVAAHSLLPEQNTSLKTEINLKEQLTIQTSDKCMKNLDEEQAAQTVLQDVDSLLEASIHCVVKDGIELLFNESHKSMYFSSGNITLYGVLLVNCDLQDIFKNGDILRFKFCCGEEKLCVGGHVDQENKEEMRARLSEFCDEKSLTRFVKNFLVYDFDYLYCKTLSANDTCSNEDFHNASTEDLITSKKKSNNLEPEKVSSLKDDSNNISSHSINGQQPSQSGGKAVSILHPKFAQILKSCIKEKLTECKSAKVMLDEDVDKIVQSFEQDFCNLLIGDVLTETLQSHLYPANKREGISSSDHIAGEENADTHTLVKSIVSSVKDSLSNLEPMYSNNSVQTISTGQILSLNHLVED